MTYSDTQPRGTLRYRLLSASLLPLSSPLAEPGSWGHEYVRHLAAELGEEFSAREAEEAEAAPPSTEEAPQKPAETVVGTVDDLKALAMQCATFLLGHNAEPDAVDLLVELEIVDRIVELVDDNTFGRVCAYMVACVSWSAVGNLHLIMTPGVHLFSYHRTMLFSCARCTRFTFNTTKYPRRSLLLSGSEIHYSSERTSTPLPIRACQLFPVSVFLAHSFIRLMKRQLAFLLARAQIPIEWLQSPADGDVLEELSEDIIECLSNARLSTHFREFGKELGVAEAKSLEDVYKSHLENTSTCHKPLVQFSVPNQDP
jgi:26S proteasome regulatory subunit N1